MNPRDRKILALSVVLAGAFAATTANASDATSKPSCLEETRKVVVWPAGSGKSNQFGKVENHVVTICDGKVVSSKPERNAAAAKATRERDGG